MVSERELAALTADPMLLVTVLEAPEAHSAAPADGEHGAPEGDAPEGEAHA